MLETLYFLISLIVRVRPHHKYCVYVHWLFVLLLQISFSHLKPFYIVQMFDAIFKWKVISFENVQGPGFLCFS